MGKNPKAAAQRAKKKHAKEKKRQNKPHVQPKLAVPALPADRWKPAEEGIEGLATRAGVHPHLAARMVLARVAAGQVALPAHFPTTEKVASLRTEEILARLEGLGVHTDQAAFTEAARAARSGWELARATWLPSRSSRLRPEGVAPGDAPAPPPALPVLERDYVSLAAVELWKRWCPELPSRERVVDLFEDGLQAAEDGDEEAALEHWIDLWGALELFLTPDVRTLDAAEELVGTDASLRSWFDEFSIVATSLGREDAELAGRAAAVVEGALARFAGEDEEWRSHLLGDLGTLLFAAGRTAEGEKILRGLIATYPARAVGYTNLADAWTAAARESRPSLARALALLEEAAAVPVEDGDDWDLGERLDDLRVKLASPAQASESSGGATSRRDAGAGAGDPIPEA